MISLRSLRLRLRSLIRGRAVDRELDEEIRDHLDRETRRNESLGMDHAEARRRARAAFGSVDATREAHRDGRGFRWLEDAATDARVALRTFWRSPTLTLTAVVTLALGIGANTAIFSTVTAVLLRPLPFAEPDRLMMLWEENADRGWHHSDAAPANALDWKEQVAAFEDVAFYPTFTNTATLTGDGPPRLLHSVNVSGNFFAVLGIHPALGRLFRDEETWGGADPAIAGINPALRAPGIAILSDRIWRDHFGADPAIIGRTIQLDGVPIQVLGVLPRSFSYPGLDMDVWRPFAFDPAQRAQTSFRRAHWMRVVARLKSGITPAAADAQLQVVIRRLQEQYPETNTHMGGGMTPLHEYLVGDVRRPLLVLLGAVALLLAIACANVGNLLLAHAAGREREAAVRLALGAGNGRLIRQALTESLVLSALGGAAGLALGWWGTQALVALQPGMLPMGNIGVSWRVLAYVFAITTAGGLLFGVAPAIWNRTRQPAEVMKQGGRTGTASARVRRWGDALVMGEVALALLLTVGAGLLLQSFWRLRNVDAGFDPDGVLAASMVVPSSRYDTEEKTTGFYTRLVERARTLPGVSAGAANSEVPLTTPSWSSDFAVDGRAPDPAPNEVVHREITPGYLSVMRVPLIRGRDFTDQDRGDSPRVILINQALADRWFRGEDPLGKRLVFDRVPAPNPVWRTIVGVVGSERQRELRADARPEIFEPLTQHARNRMTLMVRTTGDPATLAPAVRNLIAELDPDLAITSIQTMEEVRSVSLGRQRFLATLLLLFAVVGLALAVVGVYGVMAQVARQRLPEMAVRMALGADRVKVQGLMVRRSLALVLPGVAIGGAAALATGGLLRAMLYEVAPADPATLLAVAVTLTLAAVIAAWWPASRASRADPAATLRSD